MEKLRIGILDFTGVLKKAGIRRAADNEESRLRKSIKALGHTPVVYAAEKCQIFFHGREYQVLQGKKTLKPCDVLIPRVQLVSSRLELEISILKQFQMMGVPVLNRYLSVLNAKNKLRTSQILAQKGIPLPKTVVVRKFEYLDAAIDRVGGYPIILKSPYGSYGCGVVIVESRRSLYSALDFMIQGMRSNILMIQEYVSEAEGADYRVFVVGGKVVASMKRQAKQGDFRSNLHLGGEAEKVRLTEKEKKLSIKAAKAMKLQIAGVDILRSNKGPVIMEVNANPGFVGLSKITGINVADKIVEYAIDYAKKKKLEKSRSLAKAKKSSK